jgi:hypothetical protein
MPHDHTPTSIDPLARLARARRPRVAHVTAAALTLATLVACGGGYDSTYPGGGGNGGGGGGGAVGAVTVGPGIEFTSAHNGTSNAAVDTVAVGGTVIWTWTGTDVHSVKSTGSTTFASSPVKSSGTYAATFAAPGTYTYECAVHGAAMSGRVVVLNTASPGYTRLASAARRASASHLLAGR